MNKLRYISSIVVMLLLLSVTMQVCSDLQSKMYEKDNTELADLDTEEESEDEVEGLEILLYAPHQMRSVIFTPSINPADLCARIIQQPAFEVASPPPELM